MDGVKYKINGDLTVGVRSYAGSAEEVRLDTVRYLGHDYSVTAVYKSAFEDSDIKELTLGDSVSSVSSRAFYGCKGLVSADLGPVESLGAKAFAHCTSLTSVNVSKVVTVGAYAFYGCSALASADLSSAETIGGYAFSACYGMKEIVFSEDLKDLGAKPFCWLSFYENGKKMPRTVKNLAGCTFAGEGDRTLSLVRDA
mgnify:CR=1 FL=1